MIKFYSVFGGALLAFVLAANYFGWGADSAEEGTVDPKSVRQNPGVYRTHYVGGK